MNITSMIFLASPIQAPSVILDPDQTEIYAQIHEYWKAMHNNESDMAVFSFHGAHFDSLVASDLTRIGNLWKREQSLSVSMGAMPGLWSGHDHPGMVWCRQLNVMISRYLERIVDGG